jgi:hypothetical protein
MSRISNNALQRLWKSLAQLLTADQLAELEAQYKRDLVRDRQVGEFLKYLRHCKEAGYVLNTYDPGDYPDTIIRARVKLARALAWLEKHKEWNPE